jgi:hypothetical protein
MTIQSAEHETAAAQMEEHRTIDLSRTAVNPDRRRPVRTRHRSILGVDTRWARLAETGTEPIIKGPLLLD